MFSKALKIIKTVKSDPLVLRKFCKTFYSDGLSASIVKLEQRLQRDYGAYKYKEAVFNETIESNINNFIKKPLVSIIMPVYNINPMWLEKAIDSVEKQWYTNWEFCIVDDKSKNDKTIEYLRLLNSPKIKIKFLDENSGISNASNEAIKLSNGEYIILLDNDDELTVDALYEIVNVINKDDADFIYSDEDFISMRGKYINPHFKPDFSPDLLLSHNYITHLCCLKKELLDEVGDFKSKYDGAQDYDLFLRLTEKAKNIIHIPKILYHWRMLETSTSSNSGAKPEALQRGLNVVKDALRRRNIEGDVEYGNLDHFFKVQYKIIGNPKVSIVIPFKDMSKLLEVCINSIIKKSTYTNYEIIGISNNSTDEKTFKMIDKLSKKDNRVKFYEYNKTFNYSKINNYAIKKFTTGDHIVLLNNDIEIISTDWIEQMLMHSQREDIGCVGAKLFYPDGKIQHAGVIIGLGGYAAHSHRMVEGKSYGYFNRVNIVQNLSAVTAACMMVKKDIYLKLNGLDEENFVVAYNDVDFCLRVLKNGYKNIFTPYAQAYHYESQSRGDDSKDREKTKRFDKEKENLLKFHGDIIKKGDPYYNINLTLSAEDFSFAGN